MTSLSLHRREAVKLLLAVAAGSAISACGDTAKVEKPAAIPEPQFLTAAEMAMLSAMAQTIIPTTDTPGAMEAGVPDIVQELLTGWGDDTVRDHWRAGLASFDAYFNQLEDPVTFTELDEAARTSALTQLDMSVYGGQTENAFYKDFKQTIATAYYMTEAGATEELIYDPVPGDFKGCIPYAEVGRAWAT